MEITTERNILIENKDTKNFLADAFYPEDSAELPLVLFVHGYKGYKDWGAWHLMASELARAGYFTVTFNFSHNGTTVENPSEFADLEAFGQNNFTKEISDLNAVIAYFSKDKRIDTSRIAIFGHSRGAGISLIKAYEDERIKVAIALAGVSHFGYRFPHGERLEHWQQEGVMYSENKRTGQQMPHYIQFYNDYKENEDRFNIQYAAQHLGKPLMIIQGGADDVVKDKEANLLHEWCSGSQLVVLEEAGHTFGASEPWTAEMMPADLQKATVALISFLDEKL